MTPIETRVDRNVLRQAPIQVLGEAPEITGPDGKLSAGAQKQGPGPDRRRPVAEAKG